MFPQGIIYKSGYPFFGSKQISASKQTRFLYHLARGLGSGLLAYALIVFLFTFGPIIRQEIDFRLGKSRVDLGQEFAAKALSTAQVQEEAKKYDINSYFSIVIPKIGAKENVIANVDPGDEKSYLKALEDGIAHAKGTYFPGQGKRIYLFSHSTNSPWNFAKYNAVFYLLSKLEKGDDIIVFFADKKYVYEVSDKKVVEPGDTSWLEGDTNEEELVLQTCDPPGTTWRRLIIVAKPINNQD